MPTEIIIELKDQQDFTKMPNWAKRQLVTEAMRKQVLSVEHIYNRLNKKYSIPVIRSLLMEAPEHPEPRLDDIIKAVLSYGTQFKIEFKASVTLG